MNRLGILGYRGLFFLLTPENNHDNNILLFRLFFSVSKNPDQLIVRRQSTAINRMAAGDEQSRAITRIVIPDQYATTFERLENNVVGIALEAW